MEDPVKREKTPTQESSAHTHLNGHSSISTVPSKGSLVFYDPLPSAAFSSSPSAGFEGTGLEEPLDTGGEANIMPGDGTGRNTSDSFLRSYMTDPGRTPGAHPRRPPLQSQPSSSRRPPRPQQNPSPHYPTPPPQNPSNLPENIHHSSGPPSSFHAPPPQYQTSTPYSQRSSYVGQYTVSPQPPMSMAHSPTPYSYSHGFHPGVHGQPDNSMLSPRSIHVGYQPMMQPPAPVYQYQRHSPEGSSASHLGFQNSSTPSLYTHPNINPSPPPHSPLPSSSTGQPGAAHSPTYPSPPGFRSLNFPSPMSTPPFGYPQSFPSSPPMYQSQYGPSHYPQHYAPASDQDGQGTWWYLPHGPPLSSRQFEGVQQPYQGHYQLGYPQIGHRSEMDGSYSPSAARPSSSSSYHAMSPTHQQSRMPPNELPSSSSSSATGVGIAPPMSPSRGDPSPSAIGGAPSTPERPVIRRAYHPNPPAHRSEWVMWTGNVPSDTTHDELWRFFNQPLPSSPRISTASSADSQSESDDTISGGVISIFLISRSNCAFVNFETEAHLQAAIVRYNGQALRSVDPRCPRLVCRMRRKDDDLKAGVGGQRGMGMHTRWIKAKRDQSQEVGDPSPATTSEEPSTPPSGSEQLSSAMAQMSLSSDEEGMRHPSKRVKGHSNSSGSYASTNSSILTRYFPKRYFILKSLTQFDLDLSVEKGLWATQKHNEGILDQAYRTSKEVYLIFGVNKSGEFYGYARMSGPVLHGEHRVSWATRSTDSPGSSRSSISPATGRGSLQSETIPEESDSPTRPSGRRKEPTTFFSPVEHRLVEKSPLPVSPPNAQGSQRQLSIQQTIAEEVTPAGTGHQPQSAPADLGPPRHKSTLQTPRMKHSLDYDKLRPIAPALLAASKERSDGFELDPNAPGDHVRGSYDRSGEAEASAGPSLPKVPEEEEKGDEGVTEDADEGPPQAAEEAVNREEGWGESFKIEWICTEKLPFYRTRHLRNPWNHDREVKVSRDGTELEPTVGQKLLEEWVHLSEPPSQPATTDSSRRGGAGTAKSAPTSPTTSTLPRGALSRS